MSLTVIRKEPSRRNFLVYDLEWIPGTLEVRLVGCFDKVRGYRVYKSVGEFLDNELCESNRNAWFYAHAGGLADVQFILDEVIQLPAYEVKASFSGSSAIIVHIKRGKNTWHFVDSYWLLRDSLKNIGKAIGMEKGESVAGFENFSEVQKREWYTNARYEELRIYNEQDCQILWHAIGQFENTIMDWGGQLKMTLASTAMELFRRRFLKKDIETSSRINQKARHAYFASRVEVFASDCFDAHYYDINSSFPYAMTQPCPGQYLGSSRKLPDDEKSLYMADVEIEVPEQYFPPTPFRARGRVFFPTGRWRSWLTSVDLQLLLQQGGRLHSVHEVMRFEPFYDLAAYAQGIYEHRKKATDPFVRTVDKLLMNSLYGKFAESAVKQSLYINPSKKVLLRWDENQSESAGIVSMLMPNAFLETSEHAVPHMHVPISAHVTALARKSIFDYMSLCNDFHYCDTDGFSTTEGLQLTSNELGDLKHERDIQEGKFIAPKVYRLDEKVKAKGFSLSRDGEEARKQFRDLIENQKVSVVRMIRLRELYRKGETKPREGTIEKGLTGIFSGRTLPKRLMYPDGATRPWKVKEIEGALK